MSERAVPVNTSGQISNHVRRSLACFSTLSDELVLAGINESQNEPRRLAPGLETVLRKAVGVTIHGLARGISPRLEEGGIFRTGYLLDRRIVLRVHASEVGLNGLEEGSDNLRLNWAVERHEVSKHDVTILSDYTGCLAIKNAALVREVPRHPIVPPHELPAIDKYIGSALLQAVLIEELEPYFAEQAI